MQRRHAGRYGVAWHLRVQLLLCPSRPLAPCRLWALNANSRTLPGPQAVLNPLPAIFGIDVVSA